MVKDSFGSDHVDQSGPHRVIPFVGKDLGFFSVRVRQLGMPHSPVQRTEMPLEAKGNLREEKAKPQ